MTRLKGSDPNHVTRRRLLKGAGGLVAATVPIAIGASSQSSPATGRAAETRGDVTGRLARYMVAARDRQLPPSVVREARERILDTIGAMISGAALLPGTKATQYVRAQGGTP